MARFPRLQANLVTGRRADTMAAVGIQRLSLARSLRLALMGLTLALAVIVGLGVAGLYHARERYESRLVQSEGQAITESQALLASELRGVARAGRRDTAAALARASAGGRQAELAVQARAQARQRVARATAQRDSRHALEVVIGAAILALLAAAGLIAGLVRSLRRPLDELVSATRDLATGKLDRRVTVGGPRELQLLGRAFNAMGEEMAVAQERIDAERRQLADTVESLGDALLITEGELGRVVAVNPRAGELVPELPVGARPDDADSPLPALDAALEREMEIEHSGRWLAVTASRAGAGVVWTVRDVSERARLERAKSEFVAMASHELRSPLTSINGFVELLDRSAENMTDRQREFIDIILRSTDRLVELVGDLLDVARIEADRVEIDRRPIDLGEAVRDVVALMEPRFAEKQQHLGVYVAPTLPLAFADPNRIRQVIANLLTNAHLYTEPEGRIHIGVEAERAWVQIVVADSGVGLTEEERERVFERFYRATGSASGPGTGLGLSIVKSLVELHEGEIEVDSEPGQGTTFRVRLPSAVPEAGSAQTLDSVRGRRVLVVDDEAEIAELIAGQLAPLEITAQVETDSRRALAALRSEPFDAITLDILMPELDGLSLLSEIRADPRLRRVPVVFVSVQAERPELAGEWRVTKPIDADELREVLALAVSSGRSRVLVVAREELQPRLELALDDLGIEHEWQTSGPAAARVCAERRFEVALIDVGIRSPQAVLQALDLRGRRLRRGVILFSDGATPTPPGIERLGMEVVPATEAASAVLAALRRERDERDDLVRR